MKIYGISDYRMLKRYMEIENSEVRNEMKETWGSSLSLVE